MRYLLFLFFPFFLFAYPPDLSDYSCEDGVFYASHQRHTQQVTPYDSQSNCRSNETIQLLDDGSVDIFILEANWTPDACTRDYYYLTYTCVSECPSSQPYFDENHNYCTDVPPDPECPIGEHYDYSQESCVCDNGLPKINGECQVPTCPSVFNSLPLFKIADSVPECNFFEMSDGEALTRPDGKVCCYGQESENNDTCPPNYIEINGECYPMTDNNRSDPRDCPEGQWWDSSYNDWQGGCIPIFPDENQTDNNSSTGDSGDSGDTGDSGGTDDLNGSDTVDMLTNADLFGGEMTTDQYSDGLIDYTSRSYANVRRLLDSYVLVQLPISVTGTCSDELVQSFSILGKSYTVNLTSWFQKINDYNSLIYALVMFVFGISGVIIVASGRSD